MEASIVVRLIDQTQAGFSQVNRNLSSIESSGQRLTRSLQGMQAAASAFVSALAVREVLTFVNNLQSMENRLKLVTSGQGELNKRFDELAQVATATRAPIRETVDLYTKLAQSQDVVGKSGSDLNKIVQAFNISLGLSGTSGAQASAAILQFSQAMQSGRLNGDEFRTMLEQAPRFLKALSDATGIARGDLKKFASEGLLDSKIIAQALIDALPQLQSEFGKTSMTVGQATTALSNSFILMAREFDSATGASETLVKFIQLLERNLEIVTIALGTFAAALAIGTLIQAVTFAMAGLTAGVKALGAALTFLAATPLGRVVSILGLAAGAALAFGKDTKAAEQEAEKLSDTTKQLATETQKGLKPSDEMQKLMKQLGVSAKGTKDAYQDFIRELKEEIELSKLDSREKQIQQTVYKALAAEAKKFGGDLSRISATRRAEIEAEVRALSAQVEDEKAKTDQRKKLADDLRRKQEEYDDFIKNSRSKNLEGLELFLAQSKQAEDDYRAGNFRDEKQYQEYMAALRQGYQNAYAKKAEEFRISQLSKEDAYRREVDRLTKEYDAGMIRNQEDFEALREQIRIKYAQKYDEMAKQQRENELTAVQKYQKDIIELEDAKNAGLIKSQEDYDAIRRKIEKDYREETVREYGNLYNVLNEKLLEFSGMTQKEYGIVKDVIKLTFGVDVEDLIKEFFAASIRYVLGFRTAATNDMNGIGGIISKIFGQNEEPLTQIAGFGVTGIGHIGGFGKESKSIFSSIGDIISDVFSGGLSFIGSFVKGGLELLKGFGSGAGNIFGKIGDFIGDIFGGGGGGGGGFDILGTIGDVIGKGADILGDVVGGVGDIFSDVVGGIGSFVKDIPIVGDVISGIGDLFGGATGGITELFSGSGALGSIGAVASAVPLVGVGMGIVNFIGDLFGGYEPGLDTAAGREKMYAQVNASQQRFMAIQAQKEDPKFKASQRYQALVKAADSGILQDTYTYYVAGKPLPTDYVKKGGRLPAEKDFKSRFERDFTTPLGIAFPGGGKGVYYMAMGGILNRPTMFSSSQGLAIAGEAGPEAVLPLARTSSGELGVNAGGSGAINVTFNVNTMDAKDFDTLLIEKKQLITNIVSNAVRQGRSFA